MIRPARETDAEALAPLLAQLGYPFGSAEIAPVLPELLRDPAHHVLVAEDDGEVVGFVNGGRSRSADPAYPGEIYAIYVLPAHHGHGHGSALMRAGARELVARGWRAMVIWVLRENAPSRLFYERMGGTHLRDRDEDREIEGATIVEAGYAWDDVSALARRA